MLFLSALRRRPGNAPRLALAFALAFFLSFGLGGPWPGLSLGASRAALAQGDRVAAASYPVWLFTRYLNYGRDYFRVELMTRPDTGCPHEFNPQPQDLEKLTQTKILVENGLRLEIYLERALRVAPTDIFLIDASQNVPTLALSYGRLSLPGETQDPAVALSPNPHIFLSPRLASLMTENIANALISRDPGGEYHYKERLAAFQKDVASLEADFALFKKTRRGYKIVTSHGFMDYLAQDLGLSVLADIEPAPEVAPSSRRLQALSALIKAERVTAILLDPEANLKLAQTLGAETSIPVAVIDPVTAGAADPPVDYYQEVLRSDLRIFLKLFPVNAG
ncbi:MAG: metal ABC transporter substrate-binding protein [Deltaproteobacteria bacterium]|jgi:ABC-type Zn uptake system ZnuABC Zn-binding protein ZnuA|nr:metal ABC transporter substrate-binding protein [Deltaproteobacteria bacterium]